MHHMIITCSLRQSTPQYGKGERFAGQLLPGCKTGIHWDNAFLKHELVVRPDSSW